MSHCKEAQASVGGQSVLLETVYAYYTMKETMMSESQNATSRTVELRALAARIQSGPLDDALNEEIALGLGWVRARPYRFIWRTPDLIELGDLPDWLNDLNDAISLVPPGYNWSVAKHGEQEFEANVTLPAVAPDALRPGYIVIAATAVAALTGAALLAMGEGR